MTAADDYADLARLAEAATPGPWEFGNDWGVITSGSDSVIHGYYEGRCPDCGTEIEEDASVAVSVEDAEFIAAANPATILRLLDECASLQEDASVATQRAEHAEAERDALAARLAAVEVEHEALADSLRAEAAQIVSQVSDEPMRQPTPLDELLGIDPNDTAMRLAARAVQAQRQLTLFARRLAAVEALLGRWHEYADPADLQDDLRAALAAPTDTTKEN